MERLLQDLRFGFRSLAKRPGLTVVAVLSLGLGIGANTTVFTWLQAFVLRPLPMVAGYDRMVAVNTRAPDGGSWSLSWPDFRDQREQSRSVELALFDMTQFGMRYGADATERVWGMVVSGNYFEMLRLRPAAGRFFQPREEDERAQVAVLGWSFWQRRFGGDSAMMGSSLLLNGQSFVVVGVAPPRFGGTFVGLQFDVFVPVTTLPVLTAWGAQAMTGRQFQTFEAIGRIRSGFTRDQAAQELDAVARAAGIAGGVANHNGVKLSPANSEGASEFLGPVLMALLGITALVLLIACANVANLLLARAAARRREIGIRLAMGASRVRIVRQLLTESVALATLAGIVGVVVAFWGRDLMRGLVPAAPFPIGLEMRIDGGVLLFAVAVTGFAALAFGLAPALQASSPDLVPTLKDEIGAGQPRRARLQSALVIGQVALSLVSLVAAGLFLRSLRASGNVDTGFTNPALVLLAGTDLGLAGIRGDSNQVAVTQRLLERVRAVPGVRSAGIATHVPLGFGGYSSSGTRIEGYTPQPNENTSIGHVTVSGGYFATMGIEVVQGRAIGDADVADDAPVVVVNEQFVRRYLEGREPIGVRINQGGERWLSIVGVVRNVKQAQLTEDPRPTVYRTYGWWFTPGSYTLHVRAEGDPFALAAPLRRAFAATAADLPFLDVRTMAESMGAAILVQRLGATMLAIFGLLALVLAAIGIYGTMAYQVSRRVREIGVRVALGAARTDVISLVLGRAMRLAAAGLALGLVLALVAGKLMSTLLLGISPSDPITFISIGLLLAAVAAMASWLPARRAARVDPMVALRYE
jgi:predicted permease